MKLELKVNIPQSLSGIKLHQYQKYVKLLKDTDTENNESNEFVNLKALEIFCGLQLKDSYKLPISTFDSVLQQVNVCLNEDTPLVKRFWFKGDNDVEVEYGMIPNLHEMSFGEYIDLESYVSDWTKMHKAMAILFRPVTAKSKDMYKIEEYESSDKYSDIMKYMPVNVALGAIVFFYRLGMKLSNLTTSYMYNQLTEEERLKAESKFLEKNGVGISQFMQSLKETSQNFNKLQDFPTNRV